MREAQAFIDGICHDQPTTESAPLEVSGVALPPAIPRVSTFDVGGIPRAHLYLPPSGRRAVVAVVAVAVS